MGDFATDTILTPIVDAALIGRADTGGRPRVATVDLTDLHGCPSCGRVDATGARVVARLIMVRLRRLQEEIP